MKKNFMLFVVLVTTFVSCAQETKKSPDTKPTKILKLDMNLSAFGVESDNFPSITGFIDFEKDSSHCQTSYYNPAYQGKVYTYSPAEIKEILNLLESIDLSKLKEKYSNDRSDQPTSTITIYTDQQPYTVEDYGLNGEQSLEKLYELIYKF